MAGLKKNASKPSYGFNIVHGLQFNEKRSNLYVHSSTFSVSVYMLRVTARG